MPNNRNSGDHNSYPADPKSGVNWIWIIALVLIALIVGLVAGQMWAKRQLAEVSSNEDATVSEDAEANANAREKVEPSSKKPVLTVETVTPTPSKVDQSLTADGTISPKNTSSVSGKVNGYAIEQVLVKEGDQVNQGQVLAVFDTDTMQQQKVQAEAELAEAQSNLELAERDLNRVLPLRDIQAISQQEIDRYMSVVNQSKAAVVASKARLDNQIINLQNSRVTAPVNGVISEKNANVGSVPGPEPLFKIIEAGQLEWQAQVDPNKVGKIEVGTPVEVSLPNKQKVMGRVTRISPTVEDGNRQITIYAALAPHQNAKAGMYQSGTFKLGSEPKVTIPVSAVVTQDGYDYVMQVKAVKDENRKTIHRVSRVKVKLGERQGDRVVLLEPLSGNGKIVRQGGSFLSDGDVVRITDATS